MSEYAVHFTKEADGATAYQVTMKILRELRIEPSGPFGAARNLTELSQSQMSACFSEIPLDLLDRLIARRSLYGIGFRQDFLVEKGGARVWYVDKDGSVAESLKEVVRSRMVGGIDPTDPLWKVTPCIDYPGDYGGTQYRFEWEREWRVAGGLSFEPQDVAFLFLPEHEHGRARSFFEEALRQNIGPAFLCPYIDPRWGLPRIQTALEPIPLVSAPTSAPPREPNFAEADPCEYCGGRVENDWCLGCGRWVHR